MSMLNISTMALAGSLALGGTVLAGSCLMGCSSQAPEPPPPAKTVFDPLTQQLERAREVQKTVDQNADSTRKALDSQERGDTPP